MSNSTKSVNKIGRLCSPSRELRFDLHDRHGIAHEGLQARPPDGTDASGRWNTAPCSSMFTFLMEGFALYGGSYCGLPHAIAMSTVESRPAEAQAGQAERLSIRERRRSIAIVYSSTSPEVARAELEDNTNRAGPGSEAWSEDAGLSRFYDWPSSTERSSHRNWLTRPWSAIASRWAKWHREREIKKTVAALVEFDDRTLRDIGIPCRSEIEQVVRYGRDCGRSRR